MGICVICVPRVPYGTRGFASCKPAWAESLCAPLHIPHIFIGMAQKHGGKTPIVSAFGVTGAAFTVFCAVFTGRMLFEETVLTWNQGPQMLGFSLAHGSGAILFLAPILLSLWIVLFGAALVRWWWKKVRPSTSTLCVGLAAVIVIGVLSIPSNFWIWLDPSPYARRGHGPELATYAAAQGQTQTVLALLNAGVEVNGRDHDEQTLAHVAAKTGNLRLLHVLRDRHADLNLLDGYKNSPVFYAQQGHHDAAVIYLTLA
jgi:hypothetical protein